MPSRIINKSTQATHRGTWQFLFAFVKVRKHCRLHYYDYLVLIHDIIIHDI